MDKSYFIRKFVSNQIENMNKVEFYNKAIEVYKKTGQGLPFFLKHRLPNPYIVDELVDEGLMKIVNQSYKTLPDDQWICLTNVYCVEEAMNSQALTFMKLYLGIDPLIEMGSIRYTIKQANMDSEFMKNYSEWLFENSDILKKIDTIEFLKEEGNDLDSKTLEFIKSRSWFKNNKSVKICKEKLNNVHDRISILKQLISLKTRHGSYSKEEIEKDKNQLNEEKDSLKYIAKINIFLNKQDENSLIQNII